MSTRSHNKAEHIQLSDRTYEITLPLKASALDDYDDYYFTLEERDTDQTLHIDYSINEKVDDYSVIRLLVPFSDHEQTFMRHDIWDLYLNRRKGNDVERSRIKADRDDYRFLTILFPEEEKMFYPYTTDKGKLSFRLNHYFLYAKIEKLTLKETQLHISGLFNFPPLYKTTDYTVDQLKMIVTVGESAEEVEIPVERVPRKDIADNYDGNDEMLRTGFNGTFDFSRFLEESEQLFFKFYLEMHYTTTDGTTGIRRSPRLRVRKEPQHYIKKVMPGRNVKRKVLIKPTKTSHYLSFKLSDYNFKNEVIGNLKSAWVKVRRGEKLKYLYKVAFKILGQLPVRKKTIMFESFLGKQYSDSPRAIYEYMKTHHPDFDMYWSADRRHLAYFENKNVPYIRRFSIRWLLKMSRAEYWVSNSRLPLWIPKPGHTTYLQTWHGTPLKRLAADMDEVHMPGTNTEKYKRNFLQASSKWDYLVSPNAYSTEIFRRAFQFDKKMVESGYPRNDFLINSNNEETIRQIKQKIGLPEHKKVMLYAPTWRDNQFYSRGKYKFNLEMDLDQMRAGLGEDYILLLRLHYLVAENLDLTGYDDFVYDVSAHEDIRELYLISDMLITDYSSVFFDYANLKRPMLFYVYDIDDYRDNLRGFYFDFENKAPGPLVKTTEALLNEIKAIDREGYEPYGTTEAFYQKFCYLEDGNASRRVAEEVFIGN
ncbi:CDP-glycerol glycerophosphotransferase family protein [Lentibacillus persicus]|nr:CDP-glycerol glycerophosphotransferase family protein [Lentibacillus persicus]